MDNEGNTTLKSFIKNHNPEDLMIWFFIALIVVIFIILLIPQNKKEGAVNVRVEPKETITLMGNNPYYLLKGKPYEEPTYEERASLVLRHLRENEAMKGERTAVLEMRTMYSGYFRGVSHFKPKKIRLMSAQTVAECEEIILG